LDEVTSQLDPELEQEAYTLMKQRLRDTTVISVAHRTSLDRFHGRSIVLQDKRLVEWAVEKPRADFANPES
ncbi:MAG: hypothetical protein CME89_08360, partial [Hirschia sp.]|nr:hypothetical protein [Hirschia sp.]